MYLCLFFTVPSAVEDVNVIPQSPDAILVSWSLPSQPNGPIQQIVYFLKWSTKIDNSTHTYVSDAIRWEAMQTFNYGMFEVNRDGLRSNQTYSFQVRHLVW